MTTDEFEKLWGKGSDVLYRPNKTAEIIKAFNSVITGMYFLGTEEQYIFDTLNTTTYVQEEYKSLQNKLGIDIQDIAEKFELMRSILFGDCLDWEFICDKLNGVKEEI